MNVFLLILPIFLFWFLSILHTPFYIKFPSKLNAWMDSFLSASWLFPPAPAPSTLKPRRSAASTNPQGPRAVITELGVMCFGEERTGFDMGLSRAVEARPRRKWC